MKHLAITAKINEFIKERLIGQLEDFTEELKEGGLHTFEVGLSGLMDEFYNLVAGEVLAISAQKSVGLLEAKAREQRLGKLERRPMSVQIKTGHYVRVEGLYAKKAPVGFPGSRHLLASHWKMIKGASPSYYSAICMLGVLSPSFEVAGKILDLQGVAYNLDRIQQLTRQVAKHCQGRQAELSRDVGESLKGLRVVIGIDGGRTRMREYKGEKNAKGNATFKTPWKEPKMFVIDVLNEEGIVNRHKLPIYGCLFGDDELIALLASHLQGLDIEQAMQVQIVADGAPWIWNRVRQMLSDLGVQAEKIVETVDYYHACQYVHKIVQGLPQKFARQSASLLKTFKQWLWEGNAKAIVEKCGELFKRPGKEIITYLGYLDKNQKRMQYAEYQDKKLMCGSGIIESGIRRVINLRFKNASAFWKQSNVEGLYFLRGILLAFRWNIMINNLVKA